MIISKKFFGALTLVLSLSIASFSAAEIKNPKLQKAVFAGGCFWSIQKAFDNANGVVKTTAGFMGGKIKNPSYDRVSIGNTGHVEAVEVYYDPDKTNFNKLLDTFWHATDPTNQQGVICDFAPEYHTAIFTYDNQQFELANSSKAAVGKQLNKKIYTQITIANTPFYPAESYHQHYWRTHHWEYENYRQGCGRDVALKKLWGN